MSDNDASVSRRRFMQAAAGTATAAAATGTATAQETTTEGGNETTAAGNETTGTEDGGGGGGGGGEPDLGGFLDGANNFDGSVSDMRGQDEVTVEVGAGSDGLAFGPAAVHVDNGATVVWEWTGEGGAHNVVEQGDEVFNSGSPKNTGTYEYTFEEDGIYNYVCVPHEASGMLGVVVVGSDYPTVESGGDSGPSDLPSSAKTLGVATMLVMVATLGMAYFFMKYGGDYGDFEE
ncbi:halocyanin domain-containing protein [Salinibaculum salinum]|uniref:halocyanin domain-containing protein n=1 Tax=Salinibaculum salinum TaxID=3131996 RepID=UPI0030EE31CA